MPGNPLLLQLVCLLPSSAAQATASPKRRHDAAANRIPDRIAASGPPAGLLAEEQTGRWPSGNLRYLLHITWSTRPYSAASTGLSTFELSDSTTVLRPSALTAPIVL